MNKRQVKRQKANCKGQKYFSQLAFCLLPFAFCLLPCRIVLADTAASFYDPSWGGELSWADNPLFARPPASNAYLDNNSPDSNSLPWWQTRGQTPSWITTPRNWE